MKKPPDHNARGGVGRSLRPADPAGVPPAVADVGADPLRGLAGPRDPAVAPTTERPTRPSLWSRIKRAFQYGSQGGEDG